MDRTDPICCPNCGQVAFRRYYVSTSTCHHKCPGGLVTQVECPACDYYLSSCAANGQVLEAYAGAATMPRGVRAVVGCRVGSTVTKPAIALNANWSSIKNADIPKTT